MPQITRQVSRPAFKTLGYKEGKTILRVVSKPPNSGAKHTQIGIYNGFMENALLINTGENSTSIIPVGNIEEVGVIELVQLLDLVNNLIKFTEKNDLLSQKQL